MYQKLRRTTSTIFFFLLFFFLSVRNDGCEGTNLASTLSDEDLYQLIDFATSGHTFDTRPEIYYAAAPSSAPNLESDSPISKQLEEQAKTQTGEQEQKTQSDSEPTAAQQQPEESQPAVVVGGGGEESQASTQPPEAPIPTTTTTTTTTTAIPISTESTSPTPTPHPTIELGSDISFIPLTNDYININNQAYTIQEVSSPITLPTQAPSSASPSLSSSGGDILSNVNFIPFSILQQIDPNAQYQIQEIQIPVSSSSSSDSNGVQNNVNFNAQYSLQQIQLPLPSPSPSTVPTVQNINFNPSPPQQQYQIQQIQLPTPSPSPPSNTVLQSSSPIFNPSAYMSNFNNNYNSNNNNNDAVNDFNNNLNSIIANSLNKVINGNHNQPNNNNFNQVNNVNTPNYYTTEKSQSEGKRQSSTIEIISSLELPSKHTQYVQDSQNGFVHVKSNTPLGHHDPYINTPRPYDRFTPNSYDSLRPYDSIPYPDQNPAFSSNRNAQKVPEPSAQPPESQHSSHHSNNNIPPRVLEANQFFSDNQIFPSPSPPPPQPTYFTPSQSPSLQGIDGFPGPTLVYAPPPTRPIYAPTPTGPVYAPPPPLGPIYAPPPPTKEEAESDYPPQPVQNRQNQHRQYHDFVHEQAVRRFLHNSPSSEAERKYGPEGRAVSHHPHHHNILLQNVPPLYPGQSRPQFFHPSPSPPQSQYNEESGSVQSQISQQQQQQTQQPTRQIHQQYSPVQQPQHHPNHSPLIQSFSRNNPSPPPPNNVPQQQHRLQYQSNLISRAQPISKLIQENPSINQIADSASAAASAALRKVIANVGRVRGNEAEEQDEEEDIDEEDEDRDGRRRGMEGLIRNSDQTSSVVMNDDGSTSPLTSSEEQTLLEQAQDQQPEVEIRHNNGQPIVTVKTKRIISKPSSKYNSFSSSGEGESGRDGRGRKITKSVVTTRVVASFKKPQQQQQHRPTTTTLTAESMRGGNRRVIMSHQNDRQL